MRLPLMKEKEPGYSNVSTASTSSGSSSPSSGGCSTGGSSCNSGYGGCPVDPDIVANCAEETPRSINNLDAFFALVKGNLGPGVLALPFAFGQAGWATGLPVLILVVAQGVYVMLLLSECKRAVMRPGVTDLGDIAQICLGVVGRVAADFFVFTIQGGCCCCFVNLVSGNLAETFAWDRRRTTVLVAPFFAAFAVLRFVAQLSFLNKFGTVAMIVGIVTGTVCGIERLHMMGPEVFVARAAPLRPFSDPIMLAASVFFAFEGLGIVLPIEKEMTRPSSFPKVLGMASAVLAAAFLCVSITCGIAYRGELHSGSIVDFLATRPGGGAGHRFLQAADLLVTAAVFVTYPLQLLPAAEIFRKWLSKISKIMQPAADEGSARSATPEAADSPAEAPASAWVLQRLALVATTVLIALLVKNVSLLVSLVGAVGQTGLGLLVPLCHLSLVRSGKVRCLRAQVVVNVLILVFCVVIMIFGSYFAIMDILAEM